MAGSVTIIVCFNCPCYEHQGILEQTLYSLPFHEQYHCCCHTALCFSALPQGYLYLPHPALSRKLKSPHRKSPKKSFFPRTAPKKNSLSIPAFQSVLCYNHQRLCMITEITNHPQKAMTSFITAPKSILQYKRCFLGDYHYQHTYTNTATPINFSDWRSQGSVSKFKPGLALNKGLCRQWTLTIESFCVKGNDCIIATPSSQFDWNGAVCFYVLLSTLMEVKWYDYLVVVL